jgi:hypothetical protein
MTAGIYLEDYMDKKKKQKLSAQGWRFGDAQDFLGLSKEEAAFIEFKLALSQAAKLCRLKMNLSQMEVARRLHSSQSRIAKMEKSDPSVTVDLLVKYLFALGATKKDLARIIGTKKSPLA